MLSLCCCKGFSLVAESGGYSLWRAGFLLQASRGGAGRLLAAGFRCGGQASSLQASLRRQAACCGVGRASRCRLRCGGQASRGACCGGQASSLQGFAWRAGCSAAGRLLAGFAGRLLAKCGFAAAGRLRCGGFSCGRAWAPGMQASVAAAHGPRGCGSWLQSTGPQLWCRGLVALQHLGSSWIRSKPMSPALAGSTIHP